MGQRGPLPKSATERLGNSRGKADPLSNVRQGKSAGKPVIPEPSKEWHPVAQAVFKSLKMSGQAQWYETTDWAMAWVMCTLLDEMYQTRFTASMMAQFNDLSTRLMMCEGDRRRAHVELLRAGGDDDEAEAEVSLKDIRKQISGRASAA